MESHGVLVGWVHHDFGERVMLRIETMATLDAAEHHHPDMVRVLMTKQQAAVLGTYLLKVSGQSAVSKGDRGWFRRLFG